MANDMENCKTINNEQIVFLDFDGEKTIYNNSALDLNFSVNVEDSGIDKERQMEILQILNTEYADAGISFTIEKPDDNNYFSTIFIGETRAFDSYGNFSGVAENIDVNNRIKNDKAFVIMNHNSDNQEVISVINHEIGHIVNGNQHNTTYGTLADYAAGKLISSDQTTLSISVTRQGGRKPGLAYADEKLWTARLPNGADNATITITNNGTTSSYGWNKYKTQMIVKYDNKSYSIEENQSKTFEITSNTTFTITRAAYLDLEVSSWEPVTMWVGGIIGYKIIGYNYIYSSSRVTGQVSISAKYYSSYSNNNSNNNSSNNTNNNSNNNISAPANKNTIPDLKTQRCKITNASNGDIIVNFEVANKGPGEAAKTVAYIYSETQCLGSVSVSKIPGKPKGKYYYQPLSYTIKAGTLSAGKHKIKIVIK